ncbi:F-box domain-containing protein [Mycena kentingensis (nom. inval.)]|nr:F-box domain-containing protein [Mycena kentingensis (nom. inval.)]
MHVSRLITSNVPPTDAELGHVQELVAAREDEARQLEEEYRRVQEQLAALKVRKKAKKKEISQLQRVSAVIRRVPPELLAEIFVEYVQQARVVRKTILSKKCGPRVLTRVCSAWRAIALATPCIWDEMRFTFPRKASTNPPSYALDELVGRSAPHPFACFLQSKEQAAERASPPRYTSHIPVALFGAPGFLTRLRYLSIWVPATHWAELVKLAPPTFPALENLRINVKAFDAAQNTLSLLTFFHDVPHLRHLKVAVPSGAHYRYNDFAPRTLPWSQLHTLDWRCSLDARIVGSILSQALELRYCMVTGIRPSPGVPIAADALPKSTLPHLEDLYLHGLTHIHHPLLQVLTLPVLRTLDIQNIRSPLGTNPPTNILVPLQERSQFSLTYLSLGVGVDLTEVPAFLDRNPGITTLSVADWQNRDLSVHLQLSHASSDEAVSLPKLRVLAVMGKNDGVSRFAGDGLQLAWMLSSRIEDFQAAAPWARLESVELRVTGFRFCDEAEEIFEELAAGGVC